MADSMERTAQKKLRNASDLNALRNELASATDGTKVAISVCGGTGCRASGSVDVLEAFADEVERQEIQLDISLKETGCHGFCDKGPVVVIHPKGIFYQHVTPEDVPEIISETVLKGAIIDRLLYEDPSTHEKIEHELDIPFYKQQTRLVFGSNGRIDPTNIDDYIAAGGYAALSKVLSAMDPESVIEEVKKSGLRGRGGGGFPTGTKWASCREPEDPVKYVICNADEGDPGAYQDRSLLEGNPHSVLEGMIIGAYAIGARQGYIYVRNEYPLAVEHARQATIQAREYGLLGDDILGSGFSFDVRVSKGGGAFVCGESSALISSLEGKTGDPKAKYVHMSEKGLWEHPSLLNNVKTWANIPLIINKGADWYAGVGTAGSKGTMIFSLVGKVNNTGLVEVPMGITLREMVYGIGGGIADGKKFKAVQTGGPSGGCISEKDLDTPVDFDELKKKGSMMGSGAMIVMDEDTCMVDVARYFVEFLKGESCGKCFPCREGLSRMSEVLNDIAHGKGRPEDLQTLKDLASTLRNGALCALGSTAANPVISTLERFEDEYLEHINDKKCSAGVCRELLSFSIDVEKCTGCTRCLRECPVNAVIGEVRKPHSINADLCIKCGTCFDVCRFDAVVRK